jgi:iron complex outermembrane recepter protein
MLHLEEPIHRNGRASMMRLSAIKSVLAISTAFAALVHGDIASAAEQPGPTEQAVAEDAIIVTAQRRSERLEDVPMSVSVVSGDAIERSGALTLHNLQSVAPGVFIGFGGSNTQPAIRGVTTIVGGGSAENNVAVYIDGFYAGDPAAVNMDLANISSVQVLKGPQGSLYGRNATGGAILISTLPASKEWTGKLEAGYASFDEKTFSGYLSGPISEGLRVSAVGYSRTGDGYLYLSDPVTRQRTDRPASPIKSQSVRVKLEADLTEDLRLTFGYNYALVDDPRTLTFTPFQYIPASILSGLPITRALDVKAYNGSLMYRDRMNEGTISLNWDTPIGALKARGSYAHTKLNTSFDIDGSYLNVVANQSVGTFDTYQGGIDYTIDVIRDLDLVVGGDYYRDTRDLDPIDTYTGGARTTLSATKTTRESYAAYIDATYHVSDRLAVSAGGRYSHENVDYFTFAQNVVTGAFTSPRVTSSAGFSRFTPRATIRYEVAPQASIYASYSQGFKSGGWSGPPNVKIRPETISAYEVGFKIARPTFRFEVAGFYYDYKDIQVSANIRDPLCTAEPCAIRPVTTNGPKSEIYGADGQLTLMPLDRLNVRLGAAYLHAQYLSFPNANGIGWNLLTGLNMNNQVQDWSNQQMPRSPSWSGNFNVDYTVPTAFGELAISANATAVTSHVVGNPSVYGVAAGALAKEQRYRQGGYIVLNAQLGWTDPDEHFSVTAFVRNLTNKRYLIAYTGGAFGDYATLASPRVVGARLGYKF